MTYSNNPNGEVFQAVEPERHPLRWLWWLLAAAILAAIIWAISWSCTRPAPEQVTPEVPIATVNPEDIPPVDVEPGQISFADPALEQFRTQLDSMNLATGPVDDAHLTSGFQRLCADHLNGNSTPMEEVATAFGLGTITEDDAEELNHFIVTNPALCVVR